MNFAKNLKLSFNSKVSVSHPFYFGMTGHLTRRVFGILYQVKLEQKAEYHGIKYSAYHERWFLWFWIKKVERL